MESPYINELNCTVSVSTRPFYDPLCLNRMLLIVVILKLELIVFGRHALEPMA